MTTTVELPQDRKRVKIAEACGWSLCQKCGRFHDPKTNEAGEIPDYFNDLNACREMEGILLTGQATRYVKELDRILRSEVNANGTWEIHCARSEDDVCYRMFAFVHSIAAHRAEAFGNTLALW